MSIYTHSETRAHQPICHIGLHLEQERKRSQISSLILPGEKTLANKIRKSAVNKSKWRQLFVMYNKNYPGRSSDDDNDD